MKVLGVTLTLAAVQRIRLLAKEEGITGVAWVRRLVVQALRAQDRKAA